MELAKTRWNALISSEASGGDVEVKNQVWMALTHARRILEVYGREGDEYGPLDEILRLEELLRTENE